MKQIKKKNITDHLYMEKKKKNLPTFGIYMSPKSARVQCIFLSSTINIVGRQGRGRGLGATPRRSGEYNFFFFVSFAKRGRNIYI